MSHVEFDDSSSTLVVTTQWNEKELIRTVPGARWDDTTKRWRAHATWPALVALRGVFGDSLTLGESARVWGWRIRQAWIDAALIKRSALEPDPWDDTPLLDGLYPFQAAGVQFMSLVKSGLLGDEMGTGKTIQGLAFTHAKEISHGDGFPLLVICPNSVKHQWVEAVERWLPYATPYPVDGSAAKRRAVLKTAIDDPHAVVIINTESVRLFSRLAPYGSVKLKRCRECDPRYGDEELKASRCDVHVKELNRFTFRTVLLDEAHRIKDPKSQQTRAVWYVMHQSGVRYRWAMTGTPTANHPGDLWPIMHAVAPLEYPTKSNFVDRYCLTAWNARGTMDIVGIRPDTREEFFRILDPRFRRTLKAVVLTQLPPRVRQVRYCELTTAQRKMYAELADRLVTRTESGELLIAPSQLAATTRLMQFAGSSLKIEKKDPDDISTWVVTPVDPSPKLDALEEVLDELGVASRHYNGAPVLIAAEHLKLLHLAEKRLQRLGVRYAMITGEVAPVDRKRALDALERNEIRALLFTSKAGGVGLNMTAAQTLINLQRSWSLVDERQKEDRNYRIGSERHDVIQVIDIVTADTIEEDQIKRLHDKLRRLDEITRDRARMLQLDPHADLSDLDSEEHRILNTYLGLPSAA